MMLSKQIDKIIIFTIIFSFVCLINLWGIRGLMNLKGNSATKLFVQPTVWKECRIRGRKRCLQYNIIVSNDLVPLLKEFLPKDFPLNHG